MKKKRSTKKKSAKKKKLPSKKYQYGWLAELRLLSYYDPFTKKVKTKKFRKGKWSLIWNPTTKELVGISNSRLNKLGKLPEEMLRSAAMKSHIKFQNKDLNNYDFTLNYDSDIILPLKWNKLGKGKQIDYYSNKFDDGFYYYYHEFGEYEHNKPPVKNHGVNIYYDQYNDLWRAKGGKLDVTERGIIY